MEYWIIWLIIVILLAIVEVATVNLVSIWFIASGIISLFFSLVNDSFLIQFGIFVIIGIVLMLMTRPTLIKMLKPQEEKINLERVIGMTGVVTEEIKKNVIGEVKVDGKLWSAIAEKRIKKDDEIKVIARDGVKLIVEKIASEEEKPQKTNVSKKKSTTTKKKASKKVSE